MARFPASFRRSLVSAASSRVPARTFRSAGPVPSYEAGTGFVAGTITLGFTVRHALPPG